MPKLRTHVKCYSKIAVQCSSRDLQISQMNLDCYWAASISD